MAFLIPYLNFITAPIMMVLLGINGNKWAWQYKKWKSIEHFKTIQKKWTLVAAIVVPGGILLLLVIFFLDFIVNTSIKPLGF